MDARFPYIIETLVYYAGSCVFVLLSGPCRWHLQYSHSSSSSNSAAAAAGVQIESLATLPEEMDTNTHTVDDVQTKEFVWTLMEEKDLVREGGWMNLKRKKK